MPNLLTRKLELFSILPESDRSLLDELIRAPVEIGAGQDLVREGEPVEAVHLILQGFACRYKLTNHGARHIMAYLVPGDICDANLFIRSTMDHSVGTLSPCRVVSIPRTRMLQAAERPAIARALWWASLVDEATLREWLVNIGARNAEERIAHLICELYFQLRSVGLTTDNRYELPITQAELADTMGLSGVHVNRVLQSLRAEGVIALRSKNLVILNFERLIEISCFNANYRSAGREPPHAVCAHVFC